MEEIWKDIIGYEGLYQISNIGRVRSIKTNYPKIGRKRTGELLKIKTSNKGYFCVFIRGREGKQKNTLVHRLIAIHFIQNPMNKPQVNHINSIRTDNRLENLEWVTPAENNKHAYDFGNQIKRNGEDHFGAKLTQKQVLEIRSKYKYYIYSILMLAKEYNVSKGCIQAILNKKTWIL